MGRLRIIAGSLRGRRFSVPRGLRVRPTPERAREGLFSILGERVPGARLLDAYGGSGALGLEALSRGAGEVVFVEVDRRVAEVLRENVAALSLERRCRVFVADAVDALRDRLVRGPFELILADPPYRTPQAERFAAAAAAPGWLTPGGLLVIERQTGEPPLERAGGRLERRRTARYGDTRFDFYPADPRT